MKANRFAQWVGPAAAAACGFCCAFAAPLRAAEPIPDGAIVVLPIREQVSDTLFLFMRRALKEAERAGANAVVLDMDTPGGSLSATQKIVEALLKTSTPVYTYVNPEAFSAGALISMATTGVYMAPTSAIGAAAVVMGGGQDLPETMQKKVTSGYAAFFRSVAEQRGYNPDIVSAFMGEEKELKIGDRILNKEGEVLSFSASEASERIDGQRVLAEGIAESIEDLAAQAGLTGKIHRFEETGFEAIAFWLTAIGPILLTAGLILGYLEFNSPGFGIPGILSACCFLLFFAGNYLAGLAGFELAAVFFLGLALVFLEVVFFPGVIVVGLSGVALMLGALLFAMVDSYPNQGLEIPVEAFIEPVFTLAGTLLAAAAVATVVAKYLPKTPGLRRLALDASVADVKEDLALDAGLGAHPGDSGSAMTMLRPSGKAFINGNVLDVVTHGEFIPRGEMVRVVQVVSNTVIVEVASGVQGAAGG